MPAAKMDDGVGSSTAHCLVHVPEGNVRGLPAVLFLHGGVTYVYPETLWQDFHDLIANNAVIRDRFVLVAPLASVGEPLAVVSQWRTKTDRFGNVNPYVDDFDEELVWDTFLRVLRDLRPGCVDLSRLAVVGYSMGGQGVWNLMVHHGSRLAAAVPFAGCCQWQGDAWGNEEAILKEVNNLAIRSYNGEADTGTYSMRDFWWLAAKRGLDWKPAERTEQHAEKVELVVHSWAESLQLCLVRGTVSSHCCWEVVFNNEDSFGLFSWLERLRCATPLPDET
eukprot:gnl/TRDRNA2_/TRDRNA2_127363_c0_seq1.p1 gnl/TRDRNA2_/TRDRNA2_127363_c0~~gnl/TRDRNA2_/TRDRNA2_127363_c0_seq1.p1  ORF type:complete len:279 (-),score=39.89 gnl/TRDRNA2_/TRDRNA2_127363_c0_seq1:42-878(-)